MVKKKHDSPDLNQLLSLYKSETLFFFDKKMTISDNVQKKLSPALIEHAVSISYSRVKDVSEPDLRDILHVVVENALRVLGSKMHAEDRFLLKNDIYAEIIDSFSFFSVREIIVIINDGVRKKFDDAENKTVGFSVSNFYFWANAYSVRRASLNKLLSDAISKHTVAIQEAQIPDTKETFISQLREQYLFYKEKWDDLTDEEKKATPWDQWWVKNGCEVSGSFIYRGLVEFGCIKKEEFLNEINSANVPSEMKIGNTTVKKNIERILACRYALKLRDEKQKK